MIALIAATVFSAAFGLVLRWAQQRRCNVFAVGFVNYAFATLYQVAEQASRGPAGQISPVSLWMGALVGTLYALNFGIFGPMIEKRGVSISTAVVRMSVMLPIIAAVLFWHETPAAIQGVGIILTLVAMPLIIIKPGVPGGLEGSAVPLLIAMFLGNGISTLLFQAYQKLGLAGEDTLFLMCLFGAATLVTFVAWRMRVKGSSWRDLVPGILLGLTNALANVTLLNALRQLPSVIVFPFYSAVGLIIAVVAARIFWDERISRREAFGVLLSIVAVALVNMG